MNDPSTVTTRASKTPQVQTHYYFKDSTSETSEGWDGYKVLINSDEGRAYVKLSTDPERLEFMRLHAHERQDTVFAQWMFYRDFKAGKAYNILIRSPEGEEASRLIGDSDDEMDEKTEEAVLKYFQENAHEVTELSQEEIENEKGGEE